MLPIFSNPMGLYALLGIPVLLAIHFLQHKSKKVSVSTLFLIEALTPETRTGKVWERIRNSLSLWMQILCVLLLAWILSKPRWLQDNAWQTIVFIVDDSARMQVFKQEAVNAVAEDIADITSRKIPTHWVLMTSSPRKAPLYRGDDSSQVIAAIEQWNPDSGEHDPGPALDTARNAIGENGASRLITFSQERAPGWQPAIGIGRIIDNVGFAGLIPHEQADSSRWRISIKNSSAKAQARDLNLQMGETTVKQTLNLNPGSVTEVNIAIPDGLDTVTASLTPDEFTRDDILPIIRNVPKALPVYINTGKESAGFFNKLVSSLPGAAISSRADARIRIETVAKLDETPSGLSSPAIFLPEQTSKAPSLAPVTAESSAFTDDLNWGGLLISKTGGLTPHAERQTLLWSGNIPLAWLQGENLILNWDWNSSTASRIPATALFLRRFLEKTQNQSPGFWSANIGSGTKFPVPEARMMRFLPAKPGEKQTSQPYAGSIPNEAGTVELFDGKSPANLVFKGAAFPADTREGDFSNCSSFVQGTLNQTGIFEKISTPDPLVPLWLALAAGALILSWIPGRHERRESR